MTSGRSPLRPSPAEVSGGAGGSNAAVVTAFVAGLVAAVITAVAGAPLHGVLVGWDVAAIVFCAWCWRWIATLGPDDTATHATRDDPGRTVTDVIVLGAAVASLAAVGGVLVQAGSRTGATQDLLAGLGLVSLVLSWLVVHTLFTLRYARLYFTGPDGGVDFNQKEPPRYTDFAYLAFTVGMAFQVSDTNLTTSTFRSTVLRHGLLSYLFGAGTVAAAVNFVVGLGSTHGG